MKNFLVLFREPDWRKDLHSEEDNRLHQINWQNWMAPLVKNDKLASGHALTLNEKLIDASGLIRDGIYYSCREIASGYFLISSNDLDEAATTMNGFPVFDCGATAEACELMQ